MKIGVDIRLLAKGVTSGISGYTRELLSELFRIDTENEYRLFYNAYRKSPLPTEWLARENVNVINGSVPNKILDASFGVLGRPKPQTLFGGCDVVFSPHFNLLPSGDYKRVITFHDLSFVHFPEHFSAKQRLWHWLQKYRAQAQDASEIIAVSKFTKTDLIRLLGIDSSKITTIYSGLSSDFKRLSRLDANLEAVKDKYRLNSPFFLYLGALERRKNLPVLIRAFALLCQKDPRFADYELVLAGRPGFGFKEIRSELDRSGCGRRVKILSSVLDDERTALYNLASVFVYPSLFEGFGFPPLEAQACGTPVISADRTSLPEVLNDSAVLFNPYKPAELADRLFSLESDVALRDKIVRRGLENVKDYSWKKCALQTLSVLEKVNEK